jgi:hypothetical protein
MAASGLAAMLLLVLVIMALVAFSHEDSMRLFMRVQGRFCDNRLSLRQQWRSEKDNQ